MQLWKRNGNDQGIRTIPHPNAFKRGSDEFSIRWMQQKIIITYAFYGNFHDTSVANRYYSLLRNISLAAEIDYRELIVRIYPNIQDRRELERHHQLCRF